jgi:hypothetical protein
MPSNVVTSFAKKTGKSVDDVEKMWDDAVEIVKKQYKDIEDGSEDFYRLVTGILKKMLKIEATAAITTGSLGGTTDSIPDPDSYKVYKKIGKIKKRKVRVESAVEYLKRVLNG